MPQRPLSRRTLLRGTGAVLALSLLDAIQERGGAAPFDSEQDLARRWPDRRAPLALSPDGRTLAVVVAELAREAPAGVPREASPVRAVSDELAGAEVVLVDVATGALERPFRAHASSTYPAWSPDGAALAVAVQDARTRYPRQAVWKPGGPLHVFADVPVVARVGWELPRWTPDGRRLVVKRVDPAAVSPAPPPLVERLTSDEPDPTSELMQPVDRPEELALVDVVAGTVRPLCRVSWVFTWRVSPDGRTAACLNLAAPVRQATQVVWRQLTLVDLDSGAARTIGDSQPGGWGASYSFSPDGRHVAWRATNVSKDPELMLVARTDRAGRLVAYDLPPDAAQGHFHALESFPPAPPLWAADGTSLWVPGNGVLLGYATDGTRLPDVPLPGGAGKVDWLTDATTAAGGEAFVLRPGRFARVELTSGRIAAAADCAQPEAGWFARAFDARAGMSYTLRRSPGGHALVRTAIAGGRTEAVAEVAEGPGAPEANVRSLAWTLPDGTACAGTLVLPQGWKPGDRPPVVMEVYGGATGRGNLSAETLDLLVKVVNPYLLAGQGFAVFYPDLPVAEREPAASLAAGGEAAVDALAASGLVDAGRIAVQGQSYGGYTVLCLLTGTTRFRAGVAVNGLADLARAAVDGQFGFTEAGQGGMRSTLWESPERYRRNSPLYALDRLAAPLMLVRGGEDRLTGEQFAAAFRAARRLGKRCELLTYRDQAHAPTLWTVEAQRDFRSRLLAFYNTHLVPR
jgi:dipeptidyl aminopeptidase/acylaminoacyl peptidase